MLTKTAIKPEAVASLVDIYKAVVRAVTKAHRLNCDKKICVRKLPHESTVWSPSPAAVDMIDRSSSLVCDVVLLAT